MFASRIIFSSAMLNKMQAKISASSWFYYKKFSKCVWMKNKDISTDQGRSWETNICSTIHEIPCPLCAGILSFYERPPQFPVMANEVHIGVLIL